MKIIKQKYQTGLIFLVLSLIIVAIYSNILDSSWHFDDIPNILENSFLHIDSLSFTQLKNTLYTDVIHPFRLGEKLYRPIPCLTFALNWYFGQDNVLGYHIVDIIIHILTACSLFLFIFNLFNTPNLKIHRGMNPFILSFLAGLLWAVHPIQTQAVTYIVQRMAQIAALFYILGMYAYIKGRFSSSPAKIITWFLLSVIFYVLALYSKSNAVMLPLSILLVEMIFFQNLGDRKTQKYICTASIVIAGFIILFGSFTFFKGNPLSFLDGYETRTFTLTERLLAEPRVILLYLSQIFFPSPDRFSLAHDIVLSSSLIKPWTTIPSIFFIIIMNLVAVLLVKKKPLISFAILFFFLNHLIESSVLSLEIIFEHRNYLPSFFLFLPIVYWLCYIVSIYWNKKKLLSIGAIFLILFLILNFSINTYIRNKVWKDEITLWTDAMSKAPNQTRPLWYLAIELAWGKASNHPKKYDMAINLFESSLKKHTPSKVHKTIILRNMGIVHFYGKNDHNKAISLFEESLKDYPDFRQPRIDLINALIQMEKFDSALEHVSFLLNLDNKSIMDYNLKGLTLLWKKDYKASLSCFQKAEELLADSSKYKINISVNASVVLSLSGEHEKAEDLLLAQISQNPGNVTCHLALVANSVRAKNDRKAQMYAKMISEKFNTAKIEYVIENFTDNPTVSALLKDDIAPMMQFFLNKTGKQE